jgi:hypothetical protein
MKAKIIENQLSYGFVSKLDLKLKLTVGYSCKTLNVIDSLYALPALIGHVRPLEQASCCGIGNGTGTIEIFQDLINFNFF